MSEAKSGSTRPRWRKWLKRILISLAIIIVVLVFGVLPYLFSVLVTSAGTRPMDRALTETPADYGLEFKDVEFRTSDGIVISAWFIPSKSKQTTIVYSHGLFRSRRELLDRAMNLCKRGYGALLYDERNHGSSGHARSTLGYFERLDVEAAVRYIREAAAPQDHIVTLGVSMGATADLLAAAETPQIEAVVADSSFLSFDDTVAHHLKLFFRLPRFPIGSEIEFFIEKRGHFDGDKLNALEAVKRIGDRPILFIAGEHDRRMPPDIARTLYDASSSPRRDLLIIDGEATKIHGHAYMAEPDLYVDRVSAFLDSRLGVAK
ncbi:MAG: hypothetical protein DMF61_03090 [Blastocatellia bacterium AA13]|nr:MAG: hypothetical protein DMF61_03090 [Blastocatellia bacterium AA13]